MTRGNLADLVVESGADPVRQSEPALRGAGQRCDPREAGVGRRVGEVGDAVFGSEGDTNSLGALGRMVVKTAMKVSDYLQSVSAETKSRKLAGAEILRRPTP